MKRLLIMGAQRSGTTLLAEVLDVQTGITIRSGVFTRVFGLAYRLGIGPRDRLDAEQRAQLLAELTHSWSDTTGRPPLRVTADRFDTLDALHRRAMAALAGDVDDVVGHKEHAPMRLVPALLERTDIHVLHIVRDARDVALSRWSRGDRRLDIAVRDWRDGYHLFASLSPHPRLHQIRYEDLVQEPRYTLARIAAWLDAELVTEPTELGARPFEWTNTTSFADPLDLFDTAPLERWRTQRDAPAVRYAGHVCAAELMRLGYEPPDPVSLTERLEYARRSRVASALGRASRARDALLRRLNR